MAKNLKSFPKKCSYLKKMFRVPFWSKISQSGFRCKLTHYNQSFDMSSIFKKVQRLRLSSVLKMVLQFISLERYPALTRYARHWHFRPRRVPCTQNNTFCTNYKGNKFGLMLPTTTLQWIFKETIIQIVWSWSAIECFILKVTLPSPACPILTNLVPIEKSEN